MTYETLDEIKIAEQKLRAELKALEEKKKEVVKEEKNKLIDQIVKDTDEKEYDLSDIISLLQKKVKGKTKKTDGGETKTTRKFKVYVDPDNSGNTYKTGPFKPWMKDKMKVQELDPDKKEDKEAFKKTLKLQE